MLELPVSYCAILDHRQPHPPAPRQPRPAAAGQPGRGDARGHLVDGDHRHAERGGGTGRGGLSEWATSGYLVSSILGGAIMAPAKGRLGALKAMVIAGFVVMAGGVISAVEPSIFWVLAGRALQGLGEGFLVALSYALVRELFPNALVPRVFGAQAVSWGDVYGP